MMQSPCPRCQTVVSYAEGTKPTCYNCGYPGADTRQANAWGQQEPQWTAPGEVQAAQPQRTSGKAVTAMVLGIVGLLVYFLSFVLGPVALGLGLSARKEIKTSNGTIGGNGMAVAGIVLGIIGTVVALFVVLAAIVFVLVSDLGEGVVAWPGFLNG